MAVIKSVTYVCEFCGYREMGSEDKAPRYWFGRSADKDSPNRKKVHLCTGCFDEVSWDYLKKNNKDLTADGQPIYLGMTLWSYNAYNEVNKIFFREGIVAVGFVNKKGQSEGCAPLSDCYMWKHNHDKAMKEAKAKDGQT